MRIASKGNWNVIGTNKESGKVIYPFYDGFSTKREAEGIRDMIEGLDSKHTYSVIKNK